MDEAMRACSGTRTRSRERGRRRRVVEKVWSWSGFGSCKRATQVQRRSSAGQAGWRAGAGYTRRPPDWVACQVDERVTCLRGATGTGGPACAALAGRLTAESCSTDGLCRPLRSSTRPHSSPTAFSPMVPLPPCDALCWRRCHRQLRHHAPDRRSCWPLLWASAVGFSC